jgi:hypothetical protein
LHTRDRKNNLLPRSASGNDDSFERNSDVVRMPPMRRF